MNFQVRSSAMFLIEKKKKKKISLEDPPPFGPIVTKIHLFDNEIDCLQPNGLQIIQQIVNAFARFENSCSILFTKNIECLFRLIEISEDLQELDLDENVIGHVCGGIILEALKSRKESQLTASKNLLPNR